jgi:hypothetical protein
MTKPGKAADGIAKTEVDHHRKCPAAGSGSMRGLRQVFEHIHDAGDLWHIKVFATTDAAEKWFEENPEGMAFEYEVIGAE